MAHQSQMKTVLNAALVVAAENGGEASTDAISRRLNVQTRLEQKRLLNVLSDLRRAGRLSRVRQAVYGPPTNGPDPDKREILWRLLRMRRRVQVDDLVEMAGVGKDYALEWLRMLVKNGVAHKQQTPGAKATWHLISNQVDMPVNTDKAAALRELRKKQKATLLAAIDTVSEALNVARVAINDMEEGE